MDEISAPMWPSTWANRLYVRNAPTEAWSKLKVKTSLMHITVASDEKGGFYLDFDTQDDKPDEEAFCALSKLYPDGTFTHYYGCEDHRICGYATYQRGSQVEHAVHKMTLEKRMYDVPIAPQYILKHLPHFGGSTTLQKMQVWGSDSGDKS